MHRQRLTHRCVGNAGSSLAVIWFQLGSNEGPLNRRFFGISGADSTVLRFVNSRMLYVELPGNRAGRLVSFYYSRPIRATQTAGQDRVQERQIVIRGDNSRLRPASRHSGRSSERMRIDPSTSVSPALYFRRTSCSIAWRFALNTSSLSLPSPLN